MDGCLLARQPASQPTSRSPGYSSTTMKRQRNSSPFLTWAACGGDFRGGEIPTSNCCANSVAQTQFRRRGDRQRARKRPITRRFPYPFFLLSLSFSSFLSSHSLVLSLSPVFSFFFFLAASLRTTYGVGSSLAAE